MPFITADQLFTHVAGVLKRGAIDVTKDAPYWQGLVARANSAAYNQIVRTLAQRGYTPQQIVAWDEGTDFSYAIGTYWSLDYGGCLGNYDDRMVTQLDRRKELLTAEVTNAGVWQAPAGVPQPIAVGAIDGSDLPFGTPIDPNDPRTGEVTRY